MSCLNNIADALQEAIANRDLCYMLRVTPAESGAEDHSIEILFDGTVRYTLEIVARGAHSSYVILRRRWRDGRVVIEDMLQGSVHDFDAVCVIDAIAMEGAAPRDLDLHGLVAALSSALVKRGLCYMLCIEPAENRLDDHTINFVSPDDGWPAFSLQIAMINRESYLALYRLGYVDGLLTRHRRLFLSDVCDFNAARIADAIAAETAAA